MKLDTGLPPGSLRNVAATADIGFDTVWTAELSHDPFLPLALAAEHTSRIKLGTAIAVAFAVTGTYDEIADKVRTRYTGLLDRVTFYMPFAGKKAERWRKHSMGNR